MGKNLKFSFLTPSECVVTALIDIFLNSDFSSMYLCIPPLNQTYPCILELIIVFGLISRFFSAVSLDINKACYVCTVFCISQLVIHIDNKLKIFFVV